MQPVSKQRIDKYSSTIWLLLETVFSIWSVQRGYKKDNWGDPISRELSSAWEAEKRWRYV
jgi:hypothetical protein